MAFDLKAALDLPSCPECGHSCPACPGHARAGEPHWVGLCGWCAETHHGTPCPECGVPGLADECYDAAFAAAAVIAENLAD